MGFVDCVKRYKCDVCGLVSTWGESWMQLTIMHKTWEEIATVCSIECAKRFDEKRGKKQ